MLTVSFVDNYNLVGQINAKCISSVAVKQEVVRQGDYLSNFPSRYLGPQVKENEALLLAR